ncbi:uncharacterized protein MKZ38_001037 [Zalerion maritima]|uniref:Membrane anchor Opy2 N-terminal domain-containing protein n=1 Tax=Zalerion maritima TaxID=339359 RepID=A0AAD5WS65_9PEZI|nr:uncharacterized protein MKZ38_001037 [Zalerion maritima]
MERSYPIPRMFFPRGTHTVRDEASLMQREEAASSSTQACNTCASLSCDDGYDCVQTQPSDFGECPIVRCEASENIVTVSGSKSNDSKTEVGPIVGGVLGGITVIAIVTYVVWRFCIKPKRQSYAGSAKMDESTETTHSAEAEKQFAQRRDQRSSTHTVHSIASTVLTRASNIIQIAYIPGVTNRATPSSPGVLVPPVPPLPLALSNQTSPSPYEEPHFFVPGDLRDSTYSGFSGYTDRTSVARTSYAARTSIAPSVSSAIISPPPVTGIRGKAAIVSLKSNGGSSGMSTPPVPSIDYEKYSKTADQKPPPSPGAASTFSVGSTFLNNASASTATQVRPQIIRVTSKHGKVNPLNIKKAGPTSPLAQTVLDGEQQTTPFRGSTMTTARDSAAVTIIDDTPVDQGPFSDPPVSSDHKSTTSLSAVIEEATRRAARTDVRTGETSRERSPFSDEHATND